ncbi:molybdopterin-binding protein [Eubacteriaceae bacterium ES3]|nr:molybdopterin-binding protein [Eubacteriaceae bacterium ES3]
MKLINTTEAVGHILCHDITQIIKGSKKEAVLKKGTVIKEEDIEMLLSIGKEHLYVWENQEGFLHENEAAEILCNCCINENMSRSDVKEGKIEIFSELKGLLKVDSDRINAINAMGDIIIATRHNNTPVNAGELLAGTRVTPLVIAKEIMDQVSNQAGSMPLLVIKPYQKKKVGILVTGSEVFKGRIKDDFGPVILEKLAEYDIQLLRKEILDDNPEMIEKSIKNLINDGAELVICTGGMSVDPDDRTPLAIKNTGAEIVSYGAPVLPGALFLLAYYKNQIPVIGLPGCVMYSKRTIFDLVLPRIMADDRITKDDLVKMGTGGICLSCDICTFPNCGFGK